MEETGVWPEGLLDAYNAMIPKSDVDATWSKTLCVLPVVQRLLGSVRLAHLGDWVASWVPDSVFSAGGGRCSVEAWYTADLDIKESFSGIADSDVDILVATLLSHLILLIVVFL